MVGKVRAEGSPGFPEAGNSGGIRPPPAMHERDFRQRSFLWTGRFLFSGLAMETVVEIGLFGVSPQWDAYDGLAERGIAFMGGAAAVLDVKAEGIGDPFLDMQAMLLEMTKELRERFQRFQSQKVLAERDADAAGDEAARKLAQTDAKAAIEAVSLIVRTLEKIDSLQRTLIAERAGADAGDADDEEALMAEFDRLVEARVKERIDAARQGWLREIGTGGDVAAPMEGGP